MDGVLSIGMLIAFQSLMQRFLEPVNSLVGLAGELQEMEGDLGRLDDVLRNASDPIVQKEISAPLDQLPATHVWLQGYIELRNITFGYNRSAPPLIDNLSQVRTVSLPGEYHSLKGNESLVLNDPKTM